MESNSGMTELQILKHKVGFMITLSNQFHCKKFSKLMQNNQKFHIQSLASVLFLQNT